MKSLVVVFSSLLLVAFCAENIMAQSRNPMRNGSSRVGGGAHSNPQQSHQKTPSKGKRIEKAPLVVLPDYIIGPEDVLEISVWKNSDLSKTVQVRPDGRISLPLIGDIVAVDQTTSQLTENIASKLKKYMAKPTVSIVVKEVNSYNIFVMGAVASPGKYALKSKTTLLQALVISGGLTDLADRNKIVVFRLGKNGKGLTKIKASYDDIVLRDGTKQNIELKPGDTVVIPAASQVLIP